MSPLRLLFIGDVMHNPIQVLVPEAESPLNGPPAATQARKDVIRRYAGADAIIFGAHFSYPCGGYIRATANGHTFVPMQPA